MHTIGSVALVGRRLEHNDHLGLAYLGTALVQSNITATRYVLNQFEDVMPIARRVCESAPLVVGVSLQDGGSAVLLLALGELVSRLRYRGHITAGGPFATLARRWLLERYAWLDSVVRFAGEVPIVELVRALSRGEPVDGVGGVTTRRGDGAPADVMSAVPMLLVPRRQDDTRLLGRGAAHVLATRGCAGRCSYCGPAALQQAEIAEGTRAGHSKRTLVEHGVGAVRRRGVGELADELSELGRSGHIYAYFVDEHLLPYREHDALRWLDELDRGLKRRHTSTMTFGCMLRAERLTSAVVRRFAEVGLVRCFVGIEFPSAEQGKIYNRQCAPEHALSILGELDRCGVASVSNLMLIHPYSTAAHIDEGIRFLRRIEHGLFEVTRMKVYHGTRLYERLEREHRLTGNPLRWGYPLSDPVAERFAELYTRVRLEALGDHSLVQQLHDVCLAIGVAKRLQLRQSLAQLGEATVELTARVRTLALDALDETLDLARSIPDRAQADKLINPIAWRVRALRSEIDRVESAAARCADLPARRFSPMAAAAASSLVFVFTGGNSGCAQEETATYVRQDAGGAGGSGGTGGTNGFISVLPQCDAGLDDAATASIAADVPCFVGSVASSGTGDLSATYNLGMGYFSGACDTTTQDRFAQLGQAATGAIADLKADNCILRTTISNSEIAALSSAIQQCAPQGFVIVLDQAGNVVDVRGPTTTDAGTAQALDCILAAVKGLSFPCLANSQLCWEEVIVE